MPSIPIHPLTPSAFAPFGDVVDAATATHLAINQGYAERADGLARIDVSADSGQVNVALFTARPRPTPIAITLMERHPLGSQLFYPLQPHPWLVLVCADPHDPTTYRAFRATGEQGVNYARNIWHHPLLVLDAPARFLVIDRAGPGNNLEERHLPPAHQPPPLSP